MCLPTRRVRTLQSALCTALFWAAVSSRFAAADRAVPPLQLVCDADLPFTKQDLAAALSVRIPEHAAVGYTVGVRAAGEGTAEVSLGERRRAVDLGERRGGPAARWVALAVIDLITQEAAPPLLPQGSAPIPRLPTPRLLVLFYPTIGLGVAENPVVATGGLGGSLRMYRGLRWTLDVSYGGSPKTRLHDVEVDLQELPLRSGPAFRPQSVPLEVRLSAVVVPYWARVTAAPGEAQHAGVVAGAGAALLAYLPLSQRLLAMVALGVDLFATRAEFLVSGQPIFDTARLTAWLGVGLALRSIR